MDIELKDVIHFYLGADCLYQWHHRESEWLQWKITPAIIVPNAVHIIKPILRPIESMAHDEAVEFIHLKNRSTMCNIDRTEVTKVTFGSTKNIINFTYHKQNSSGSKTYYVNQSDAEQFAWLLKNSFDIFNLVPRGLAIDKTKY